MYDYDGVECVKDLGLGWSYLYLLVLASSCRVYTVDQRVPIHFPRLQGSDGNITCKTKPEMTTIRAKAQSHPDTTTKFRSRPLVTSTSHFFPPSFSIRSLQTHQTISHSIHHTTTSPNTVLDRKPEDKHSQVLLHLPNLLLRLTQPLLELLLPVNLLLQGVLSQYTPLHPLLHARRRGEKKE